MVPHQVHDGLHFVGAGRDREHGILLRHDDAELAVPPVAAIKARPAAPELIAVTLLPVTLGIAAVRGLTGGGFLDPCRREELLAAPLSLLQIELAELGDILSAETQPPATGGNALRASFPNRLLD